MTDDQPEVDPLEDGLAEMEDPIGGLDGGEEDGGEDVVEEVEEVLNGDEQGIFQIYTEFISFYVEYLVSLCYFFR